MTRVGFIMRAHPREERAALVGGASKSPFRLLLALRELVTVAGVVVVDHPGGFDARGYSVTGRPVRWLKLYVRTLAWNIVNFPAVVRLFARSDVVQCHHPHYGLGAALARRLFPRVRFVVKAHGTAVPELAANDYLGARGAILAVNARLHRAHDRWVLRRADRCVVSSDFQMSEMVDVYGVDPRRLLRIHNGVDATYVRVRDRVGAEAQRAPRLLFVGRVVPKKGFQHLRDLYTTLQEAFPAATLTLVLGDRDAIEDQPTYQFVCDELASLRGCSMRFGLDEPGLYDLLRSSDIGLVPSRGYESVPTVVLEMASAGLPVFATHRWGIPEVLPAGFALSGDVDADVETLVRFIRTDLATWDSAAQARAHERFRYDALAPCYVWLYKELLDHAGA